MSYYGQRWAPYVPVAQRRASALQQMARLRKRGKDIQPIEIAGRKIATTFWGKAWCDHIEALGDFENRLPRGRTYVRNGSVCHLEIKKGVVKAIVSGSDLYNIDIEIATLPKKKWNQVKSRSAGQIGSLLELIQGKLSDNVMEVVTDPTAGLFPLAEEIELNCDCPDWATMCKHVAAVLYGIGARLDHRPELLFELRGVNHQDLICSDAAVNRVTRRSGNRRTLSVADLGDVFGIELEPDSDERKDSTNRSRNAGVKKKPAKKKTKRNPVKKVVTQAAKKKKAKTTGKGKNAKKKSPRKKTTTKPVAKKAAKKKKSVRSVVRKKTAASKKRPKRKAA